MSNVHSNYLHCLFDNRFQHVITRLASEVQTLKKTTPIDAIAIRGMSGAIVGGALSLATGIPLICVRKGRSSHSYMRVEGSYTERVNAQEMNYVIVDDLVCEGTNYQHYHERG